MWYCKKAETGVCTSAVFIIFAYKRDATEVIPVGCTFPSVFANAVDVSLQA